MAYDLRKEIEEMEHMSVEQKNRLREAYQILLDLKKDLNYNYHEYSALDTALDVLKRRL